MMRETKVIENYTVESLLLELEKIRKVELQNGEVIVTELRLCHLSLNLFFFLNNN